jgi:hypothetical protein
MPSCLFLSHPQPRDTGDYQHRVTLPGRALAAHLQVAEIQTSHPAYLTHGLAAGLLVVKMVADPAVLGLIESRRALGRPTAFEISDDFRDFPPSLPGHGFYAQPANQALIEESARRADLVQFSSHGLAEKYAGLNPRQAVLANQLEQVPPLPALSPERLAQPVIGWAGSAGHLDDARQLAAWLRPWYGSRRRAGLYLPPLRVMAPDRVAAVFLTAGLPVSVTAPARFEAYLEFLASLDIGIAVLGDTDFARGRSDGKFLEYASRGAVCVASAAGEYLHGIRDGDTGLLYRSAEELAARLSALVDDPAQRLHLRAVAYAHVSRERTHARAALSRARLYQDLLPDGAPAGSGTLQTIVDASECRFLEATTLHMSGRIHEALDGYLAVASAHPGFHEPWARSALIARTVGATQDAALFESMAQQALRSGLHA